MGMPASHAASATISAIASCSAMSLALRHLHVRHPAMPAIRQQMPHIAQRRPSVATLAKQLCLAVRPRLVRLIAARYSHASPRGREVFEAANGYRTRLSLP